MISASQVRQDLAVLGWMSPMLATSALVTIDDTAAAQDDVATHGLGGLHLGLLRAALEAAGAELSPEDSGAGRETPESGQSRGELMPRAWPGDPIFLSDAESAKRVSLTVGEWAAAAVVLERSGLPRRDPLFKNQRYWPRVRDFLYRRAGGAAPDEAETAGIVENFDALRSTRKRSTDA